MRLLAVEETAFRLGVARRSVADRRWRLRAGLRAVRIGQRRIGFKESDVNRLIEAGVEPIPGERCR